MGGVIITIDQQEAVRRFQALGLKDAAQQLDPYTQGGIFGDLEAGRITADEFQTLLSQQVGRKLSYEECRHAWLGYCGEVPQRNLQVLRKLRQEGYRLVLLSNTNPFMMSHVLSPAFDGQGHGLSDYLDALYMSFEMKVMKPDEMFFRRVLMAEQSLPSECLFVDDGPKNVAVASQIGINTFCPKNGEDWTKEIYQYLR